MRQICFLNGVQLVIGGEEHSGWLPEGAAMPLPTPVRNVVLDLSIEFDGSGYLLIHQSTDGSLAGDLWYPTLEEAQTAAGEFFKVGHSQWITA